MSKILNKCQTIEYAVPQGTVPELNLLLDKCILVFKIHFLLLLQSFKHEESQTGS